MTEEALETQACLLLQSAETALVQLSELPREAIDKQWLARIDELVSHIYSPRRKVA